MLGLNQQQGRPALQGQPRIIQIRSCGLLRFRPLGTDQQRVSAPLRTPELDREQGHLAWRRTDTPVEETSSRHRPFRPQLERSTGSEDPETELPVVWMEDARRAQLQLAIHRRRGTGVSRVLPWRHRGIRSVTAHGAPAITLLRPSHTGRLTGGDLNAALGHHLMCIASSADASSMGTAAATADVVSRCCSGSSYSIRTAYSLGTTADPNSSAYTWVNSAPKSRICDE